MKLCVCNGKARFAKANGKAPVFAKALANQDIINVLSNKATELD